MLAAGAALAVAYGNIFDGARLLEANAGEGEVFGFFCVLKATRQPQQ